MAHSWLNYARSSPVRHASTPCTGGAYSCLRGAVVPTTYLPPTTQRSECERHMRRLRATQRACRILGDEHGAACAGERLDVLLIIWRRLDQLTRLDTHEA